MGYFSNVFDAIRGRTSSPEVKNVVEKKDSPVSNLPKTRKSAADTTSYNLQIYKDGVNLVTPSFVRECIPIIRKLYKVNPDLGVALFDIIQLTNTGYSIEFDAEVKPDMADKMRKHIEKAAEEWNYGTAGLPGIINKMIAQIYVSGALSNEWVPNRSLSGIESVIFVNPENIEFSLNKRKTKYQPYQRVKSSLLSTGTQDPDLIKLNTSTYRYYGLFSDEDAPYGVPPFLTALEDIDNQKFMKKNIRHIVQQVGLMGFMEILINKPDQNANESVDQYIARLSNLLQTTKDNVGSGMTDGVMVGYDEDHQFEFHSTTKNMQGMGDVFNLVETQLANGLKTSASFLGVSMGGTETMLTIIFTKMLSQLSNVQNILAKNLQYGLALELRMAGYKFKEVKVSFKASTITDDYKIKQAEEIKIRNLNALYDQGIISQEQYAHVMGYAKPDQKEPRVERSKDVMEEASKGATREKKKDASDRKGREAGKPQPKRADQKTQ